MLITEKDKAFYKWLRMQLIVNIPNSPIIKIIDSLLKE
jgi:hypothetical protein